ncbi:MAG: PBP1A family penicillin-binding protein [Elusimicrobia bacterium]|nr:PBP1A family penicillin-binding protein [Elusimicrobiota bacterium]
MKALFLGLLAAAIAAAAFLGRGFWTYKNLERSVVQRMDQYYLAITSPGREAYLLGSDEVFEVPYMASKLSVEALPTQILDAQDRLLGEFSPRKGLYVSDPEDIPDSLKKALVATEDGNFYQHHGVNWRALLRAAAVNLKNLRVKQGGSTLTQQLAKMMFTTRQRTFGRKLFELFCARKLEGKFTKDQILLMYLNFAYFGGGCYGIESAARAYFGKSAKELELEESAMLAGLVASPSRYSPFENLELAKARQRTVLTRMARLGFISSSAARNQSPQFWRRFEAGSAVPEISFWRMEVNEAPYAVEFLRRQLLTRFSQERLIKGGLRVRTTFDLDIQREAQRALKEGLARENRGLSRETPPVEGALAAVNPEDGAVLALVGGSAFNFQNQLIRAADSRRPMGSTVKPFIFAVALASGRFRLEDEITDAPRRYPMGGGRVWSPRNYGNKYYGEVTLRLALQKSLNSVAVQLLRDADKDAVARILSQASGAPEARFPRNLSLALGAADLSALETARAYAVFVNGGRAVEPYFIRSIQDREGRTLEERKPAGELPQVLDPGVSRALLEALRGVLGPEGTAYAAAQRAGFSLPAAGKTGTTDDYRDAWFAGVTADVSAAVWIGHDDARVALGAGKSGGIVAAPIWMDFVKGIYRGRPTRPLPN